ncbi:MAG TPA: transposase, partial [Dehalococcoidia bacterium]
MRTSYPSRRSIRLPAYDYRTQGAYFITIGTHERRLIFERELWRYIAHQNWQAIEEHFPDVTVDEYIVMPNHVHGILLIERPEPEVVGAQHAAPAPPGVAPGSLGAIIRAYKASVTQAIRTASGAPMRVWQRNYYEH